MDNSEDSVPLEESSTVLEEYESSPSPLIPQQEEEEQQNLPLLSGQSPVNGLSPSCDSRRNSFHSLYNYFGNQSVDDENYGDDHGDWDYYGVDEEEEKGGSDHDHGTKNTAAASPRVEANRNNRSLSSLSSGRNDEEPSIVIEGLPAQLHPAISRGMNRVASCYFSVRSEAETPSNSTSDLGALLGVQEQQPTSTIHNDYSCTISPSVAATNDSAKNHNESPPSFLKKKEQQPSSVRFNASDILYHDIMMNVFTYLDAQALASFSQTAHRPNFEVFYFLQLQLQRALVVPTGPTTMPNSDDPLGGTIAGSGCIARLAAMDKEAAQTIVQEYLDSNSTLKTMPLSHSLAYARHILQKHGFGHQDNNDHGNDDRNKNTSTAAASSAALVVALVGVSASVMQAGSSGDASLPNTLLGMGLAGSMLKAGVSAGNAAAAARRSSDGDEAYSEETKTPNNNNNIKVAAEQLARMMHALPFLLPLQKQNKINNGDDDQLQQQQQPNNNKLDDNEDDLTTEIPRTTRDKRSRRRKSLDKSEPMDTIKEQLEQNNCINDDFEKEEAKEQSFAMQHPMTPNPYEHLPQSLDKSKKQHHPKTSNALSITSEKSATLKRKMPSGCVGAYLRAVQKATYKVTELIKQRRKENFDALSEDEKVRISRTFIDACSSDETLPVVKEMLQVQNIIDVDGFYVASDAMESCALHSAAFNGACKVVAFLVKGIGEHSSSDDGGLCDVNLRDLNGWTALHFATGANCVETVRVLASHGAKLAVEASNGYTPFHWAQRLSNHEVAEELQRLGGDIRFVEGRWQPLSLIANRFFSMIPSQS